MSSDALSLAPRVILESQFIGVDLAILDQVDTPWMTARYGFVHLRQTKLPPAALEFMALVRAIERERQKQAEPRLLSMTQSAKR